jgi:hypothetical protein
VESLKEVVMENIAEILVPVVSSAGLLAATVLAARLVRLDGYGHRPAPRGDEWSVDGLPSRPYGC